jgi:DNA-binding MarR family transcriptional regulator
MTGMRAILSFAVADRTLKGTNWQAPDFALLVVGASRPVAERLNAAVAAAGIDDMRSPYGFVIRALARAPMGLTELADYLGVTKQAAIKVVDEMEARSFLVREPHPADRRAKVLVLTDKAMAVRKAALAESRRMEHELRRELGEKDVDAMLRVLIRFAEHHGDASGARPVW